MNKFKKHNLLDFGPCLRTRNASRENPALSVHPSAFTAGALLPKGVTTCPCVAPEHTCRDPFRLEPLQKLEPSETRPCSQFALFAHKCHSCTGIFKAHGGEGPRRMANASCMAARVGFDQSSGGPASPQANATIWYKQQ